MSIVIGIVIQVASIALLLVNPLAGRFASLTAAGSFTIPSGAASITGVALGLDFLVSGLALASLIIGIIAFLRWRDGVKDLRLATSPTNLPSSTLTPPVPSGAEQGYSRAVWTLLATILVLIAGVVVIFVLTLGALLPVFNPNGTATPPGTAQIDAAVQLAVRAGVGLAAAVIVLELLLTYFVTQSLQGVVTSGGFAARSVDLGSTRLLAFIAVGISAAGLLNFIVFGLGAVAIAGPILLLVACQRYLVAFDERLGTAVGGNVLAGSRPQ